MLSTLWLTRRVKQDVSLSSSGGATMNDSWLLTNIHLRSLPVSSSTSSTSSTSSAIIIIVVVAAVVVVLPVSVILCVVVGRLPGFPPPSSSAVITSALYTSGIGDSL